MGKKKILIVEDDAIIALNNKKAIERKDYEVVGEAASGEEAVRLALELKPDLILMDIVLEGTIDGITAYENIRESFDIPVVYCTSHSDEMTLDRAKATGPQGFILKPIKQAELYSTIEIALYKHEMEAKLKESREEITRKNKELSAANEELSAAFEELGSANEELSAFNEELEIQNEELLAAQNEIMENDGKIRRLNANLTALIENTDEYILISDQEGKPVMFNSAYAGVMKEALGIEMKPGIIPHKLLPDEEVRAWWDSLHQRVLSGEKFSVEYAHDFGGDIRHLEVAYHPIVEAGKVLGFSEYTRDITERKKAQEELVKSQKALAEAEKLAKIGNWEWIMETDSLTWSDQMFEIMGIPPGRPIPSKEDQANIYHPDDREEVYKRITAVYETSIPASFEVRLPDEEGKVKHIHAVVLPSINAAGKTIGLFGTYQDITKRKLAEKQLQASLREKETLLKEVHHRVKNNFQLVSSLLGLQEASIKNEESKSILQETINRIKAMSMIHEKLYQSNDLAGIEFGEYIETISNDLCEAYRSNPGKFEMDIQAEKVQLGINQAIPCGLIINEVVSNAVKHAFPPSWKEKGTVTVLLQVKENIIELTVRDNGRGIPEHIDLETVDSLGLRLLPALVRQLMGEYEFGRDNGTVFTVRFRKEE
ncbi:MAG: response regulator [bacterium]|nr:response regulator [bacterium]